MIYGVIDSDENEISKELFKRRETRVKLKKCHLRRCV